MNVNIVVIVTYSPILQEGQWNGAGQSVTSYATAAVVEISWKSTEQTARELGSILASRSNKPDAVVAFWHLSGGFQTTEAELGKSDLAAWRHCSIPFHSDDEVSAVIRSLRSAATRTATEDFGRVLHLLCEASAKALGDHQLGDRHDRVCAELGHKGWEAVLQQPVCRLRHRLGGTLGEVFICLQSWQEDQESTAITTVRGRGGEIWGEIRSLLIGEGTCEWLKKTGLPPVVQCVLEEGSARSRLREFLQADEAQCLAQVLCKIDGPEWEQVRETIMVTRVGDPVEGFRNWHKKLDEYLRGF